MEAIGDSSLVASQNVKSEPEHQETIEFERNLDDFGKILEEEENRLVKLDEQRLKMVKELEELCLEIKEEKAKYRKAVDDIIVEREKLNKLPVELTPISSSRVYLKLVLTPLKLRRILTIKSS